MHWTEEDLANYYQRRRDELMKPAIQAAPKKGRSRGSHKAGVMNKTETDFAEHLKRLRSTGAIEDFWFEAVTLRLGPDVRFTPDFAISDPLDMGFYFCEVKGTRRGKMFSEDDAKVKIRVASQMFPCFRFFLCHKLPNGDWEQKEIR